MAIAPPNAAGRFPGERETEDTAATEISVVADIAQCINYASWQNSVPLLRSVEICNRSATTLGDLRLELETYPAFTRKKHWLGRPERAVGPQLRR